jgi:hypothetical protein
MEYQFSKEWMLALEQRFGMQTTRIGDVALPDLPKVLVFYFQDFPAKGMLTAVTGGLSNANHPSWVHGKPELMFALQTEDHGWGAAAAYFAQSFFNDDAFSYGSSYKLDKPASGDSAMNAAFVYKPAFLTQEQCKFELPDRTIHVAGLFPMYDDEVPLYEKMGVQAFWNAPNFDAYNPRRPRIASAEPVLS